MINYSVIQQNSTCNVESAQKTQNAHGAREFAFAAIFIPQLICWMLHWKEKETTFPSSYGVLLQQRARAVGVLQQNVSITLCVCIDHRSLDAGVRNAWRPENKEFSSVYRKLRHLSAGDRDLQTFSGKLSYLSYTNTLPALAPFFVVIRRMMMQNSPSFSVKWNIQQMICETSSPKGNDRSPESNVPRSNLISKTYKWAMETRGPKSNSSELLCLSWLQATLMTIW